MPNHGNTGMFAGGAVVPGLALIATLPLVWQTLLKSVSLHVGRAPAAGAETPATTAKPVASAAIMKRLFIDSSPSGPGKCP